MANPSTVSSSTAPTGRHLTLTPDLLSAAEAVIQAYDGFDWKSLKQFHFGLCELTFETPEALIKADEQLQWVALQISAATEVVIGSFNLLRKDFVKPLEDLVSAHRSISIQQYPVNKYRWITIGTPSLPDEKYKLIPKLYLQLLEVYPGSRETRFRTKLAHLGTKLELALKDFDLVIGQFQAHHRCREFLKCMLEWRELNNILGKIDALRNEMIFLDHEARASIAFNDVKFVENIGLPISPVRVGLLTDHSIVLPIRQFLPEEFVSFCKILVASEQDVEKIAVTDKLSDLAQHDHADDAKQKFVTRNRPAVSSGCHRVHFAVINCRYGLFRLPSVADTDSIRVFASSSEILASAQATHDTPMSSVSRTGKRLGASRSPLANATRASSL